MAGHWKLAVLRCNISPALILQIEITKVSFRYIYFQRTHSRFILFFSFVLEVKRILSASPPPPSRIRSSKAHNIVAMERNYNNIYTVFPWNGEGSVVGWLNWACNGEAPSSSTTLSTCLTVLVSPVFKCLAQFFFEVAKWFASYQLEFLTMLCFL